MKNISLITIVVLLFLGCKNDVKRKMEIKKTESASVVKLKKENNKFQLYVNDKPFYIKGAGLEFGDITSVAKHGGNSIRTWRTENGQRSAKEVLDEAHKQGIMVTMGIEVARERHGFDYNDKEAVKKQFERIQKEIIALKDHPALFIWAIGNELNLRYTNPKVWNALNDISKMIHKEDPNHLTTTCLAGISKEEIDYIKERCPDLDLLSFQMYGLIEKLPELVEKCGWNGPYMVTEWGATGHWEVAKTKWGAPIEENSTLKAKEYLKRYRNAIEADSTKCVGSYVFLWGQKQERTPTWYGIFLENGNETESVDVMHYLWNSSWPKNRTPQIKNYTLNEKTAYENVILKPIQDGIAEIEINNFENDSLNFRWEVLFESTDLKDGGDYEKRPEAVKMKIIENKQGILKFKAPNRKGEYRLFAYVDDNHNHSAVANIPFKVN